MADARSTTPNPHASRRRTAWLLALGCVVAGWSIHFWPHLHTANEAIRLYFAQALVDYGSPVLDPICARHGSIPVDRSEFGGHILMDKAPGLSLLATPVYAVLEGLAPSVRRKDFWLLGYLSTLLCVLLPVGLGLWQLRGWQRSIGLSERAASLTVLLLLLASPLLIYAGLLFGHGLAAALVMLAFFGLAGAGDDAPSLPRRAAAGLAAGYAGLVDTPVFLLAAMLCVYALARRGGGWRDALRVQGAMARLRDAGPFITGVAVASVAQLGYNAWVLGDPLKFTYQFKGDDALAQIHATGLLGFHLPQPEALWGLWFGAARGVFYHAPWLLAAAFGLVHAGWLDADAGPRRRRDARALLWVTVGYAAIVAGFVDWRAGDSAGARHLIPVVPLLGAGLPFVLPIGRLASAPAGRSLLRAALAAACVVGVLTHLPTVAGFPYHFAKLDFPVWELAWPTVTVFASYSESLGSLAGLSGPMAFAAQTALLALTFWLWSRGLPAQTDDVMGDATPSEAAPGALRDLGAPRTFGLFATLLLLWLAASLAPLGKPRRAVQAARYQATALLGPGIASRARFDNDPEGRLERPMPSRKRRLTARERKELELRRIARRQERDAAAGLSGSPAPRRSLRLPSAASDSTAP
ncbi:MAG: hypothetical protein RIT45_4066 [Pseudomonadota bacterium]